MMNYVEGGTLGSEFLEHYYNLEYFQQVKPVVKIRTKSKIKVSVWIKVQSKSEED